MSLERGSVVLASLDPTVGHEQRGQRPCIVVSDPEVLEDQRYPLIAIVPVTGAPGEGALYPRLEPGPSGLRKASHALVDQVRSVDKRRVRRVFGRVSSEELRQVADGLVLFLGLALDEADDAAGGEGP
ncbi:MAG TPA: type II toxin-antitoxin system PemK/MazF family toxin [Longimicrobiales bacterium]|nr:type II toxin-antitoxin system PemK/MazF family toxin [Longimicrobiales bacterium]